MHGRRTSAEDANDPGKRDRPGPLSEAHDREEFGHRMMGNDQVAVLLPTVAGSVAALCTILIHSVALRASVTLFLRERKLGVLGAGLWIDFRMFVLTMSFAFVAHLTEIALWAVLLLMCGQFSSFELAYYHSASNYTTLGSGDLIMTPSWRLLGPLEAADGALMFGVSTAMIFAMAQRLMRAKFGEL